MGLTYSQTVEKRYYGWTKGNKDKKDRYLFIDTDNELPDKIDLRDNIKHSYNQLNLSSSTSNSICTALMYDINKSSPSTKYRPSRLFLHYNSTKGNENKTYSIKDSIKCINKLGICDESQWEYTQENFNKTPTDECYLSSKFNGKIKYRKVANVLEDLKHVLNNGNIIVFGFDVYESFESSEWNPSKEIMPIPLDAEEIIGGLCVCAVGYSDNKKSFLVKNNWKNWGIGDSYFLMPYDYITSTKCKDFWVINVKTTEEIKESEESIDIDYEYVENKDKTKKIKNKIDKDKKVKIKKSKKEYNKCMIQET